MPWLEYRDSLSVYKTSYEASSNTLPGGYINLKFADKCETDTMSFYSAEYSLSGVFLGFEPLDVIIFEFFLYFLNIWFYGKEPYQNL